jgi:hypothetical protein
MADYPKYQIQPKSTYKVESIPLLGGTAPRSPDIARNTQWVPKNCTSSHTLPILLISPSFSLSPSFTHFKERCSHLSAYLDVPGMPTTPSSVSDGRTFCTRYTFLTGTD